MKRVKGMQRSGTKAIRTKIQSPKLKRQITNITIVKIRREHMINQVSSYFPKGGNSNPALETKTGKRVTKRHNTKRTYGQLSQMVANQQPYSE